MNAIRDAGVARRLVTIERELTPESRAGLLDGTLSMVISHPLRMLAESLVRALVAAVKQSGRFQELILPIELYTPESV